MVVGEVGEWNGERCGRPVRVTTHRATIPTLLMVSVLRGYKETFSELLRNTSIFYSKFQIVFCTLNLDSDV